MEPSCNMKTHVSKTAKHLTAIIIFYSNNIFQPIYCHKQKLDGMCQATSGDSEKLNSSQSHIKNDHVLNSHLEILQTASSKPNVLLSKNLKVGISQIRKMLNRLHSDTKDAMHLTAILTFFKQHLPLNHISYKLMSRKLIRWVRPNRD